MSPRITHEQLEWLRAEFEPKLGRESADLIVRLLPRVPWREALRPEDIERPKVDVTEAERARLRENLAGVLGEDAAATVIELLFEGQTVTP